MKRGYLSNYFCGVAAKRLSAVELDPERSHQHEFNGAASMRVLLGEPTSKACYTCTFIYFGDDDEEPVSEDGTLTWYDAREKARREHQVMRTEYRLYYTANTPMQLAEEGDLLIIARLQEGSCLAIIASGGTTIASQLLWLFGLEDVQLRFKIQESFGPKVNPINLTSHFILEAIGVAVEEVEEDFLTAILEKFGSSFPATRDFSAYAQSTASHVDPSDDPDDIIMIWMEKEELLFRTLEQHLIRDRLEQGFGNDVEAFLSYSLSVQNRRKSRVGYALENHLETIFSWRGLSFTRGAKIEKHSRPDFLFPSLKDYRDSNFASSLLTMLGVKSTCKDRWRQVLAEAERIEHKHLITLEPAISSNQTSEMKSKQLQLVVPESLHQSYSPEQQAWLMTLKDFTALVQERQEAVGQ